MTKRELRQKLRQLQEATPPELRHERSVAVTRRFLGLGEYTKSETIMIFLSTPAEVDTAQIALQCWSDAKRVLAPRVSWEQRRMLPMEINSLTSDVQPGLFGLREPLEGMPVPVSEIDLVLVPGMAFDEEGNRLGRGRGFYDRFLAHRDFRGITCALAFEAQVVDHVPHDDRDIRVQMLVTEKQVRRFRKPA